MVTKDMLEWSRLQREHLRAEMHLTPGGRLEAEVNEIESMHLEESIRLQEKILVRARNRLNADRATTFCRGVARAHFNIKQEIKP